MIRRLGALVICALAVRGIQGVTIQILQPTSDQQVDISNMTIEYAISSVIDGIYVVRVTLAAPGDGWLKVRCSRSEPPVPARSDVLCRRETSSLPREYASARPSSSPSTRSMTNPKSFQFHSTC